ncbi:hypothetical protein NECAME_17844, partial [Necator americanus]
MTDDKMHPIYNLTAVGLRSDFPYVNLNSRCIRIDCPYPGAEVEFTMPIGYIYTGYFIKEVGQMEVMDYILTSFRLP